MQAKPLTSNILTLTDMKKILNLIAILVAMTNTATAQDNAQPSHMTIYDSEGNLTDSYEFKYDANGNQIEETDFSNDELAGTTKRYYTYTSEGKIQSVVAHKMENGKWNVYSKNQYSYNSDGSLAGECSYQWSNGTWIPNSKTELEYNELGYTEYSFDWTGVKWEMRFKDVHCISSNGDFSTFYTYKSGNFVLISKSLVGYNDLGKDKLRQTWAIKNGNEDSSVYGPRTSYEYDDNGNLKAETTFIYDALGRSENNYKTEYSYDENGRNTSIESYVWNNGQWVLDSVERYDYAEIATCMNSINSMVAKSSVKKIIDNGRINIHVDGKSYNLNGTEDK